MSVFYLTHPPIVNHSAASPIGCDANATHDCIRHQSEVDCPLRMEQVPVENQPSLPSFDDDMSPREALRVVMRLADVFQGAGYRRLTLALLLAGFALADTMTETMAGGAVP